MWPGRHSPFNVDRWGPPTSSERHSSRGGTTSQPQSGLSSRAPERDSSEVERNMSWRDAAAWHLVPALRLPTAGRMLPSTFSSWTSRVSRITTKPKFRILKNCMGTSRTVSALFWAFRRPQSSEMTTRPVRYDSTLVASRMTSAQSSAKTTRLNGRAQGEDDEARLRMHFAER